MNTVNQQPIDNEINEIKYVFVRKELDSKNKPRRGGQIKKLNGLTWKEAEAVQFTELLQKGGERTTTYGKHFETDLKNNVIALLSVEEWIRSYLEKSKSGDGQSKIKLISIIRNFFILRTLDREIHL